MSVLVVIEGTSEMSITSNRSANPCSTVHIGQGCLRRFNGMHWSIVQGLDNVGKRDVHFAVLEINPFVVR